MKQLLKAFGPMILTVVGVIIMFGACLCGITDAFWAIFTFGLWFIFLPRLTFKEDKQFRLAYLVRTKQYGFALFGLLVKFMLLVCAPAYAVFLLYPVVYTLWPLLICLALWMLILIAWLLFLIVKFIVSMYKEAMEEYRS